MLDNELLENKCRCCDNIIENDGSSPLPVKERVLCHACKKRGSELARTMRPADVVWRGSNIHSGWGFM